MIHWTLIVISMSLFLKQIYEVYIVSVKPLSMPSYAKYLSLACYYHGMKCRQNSNFVSMWNSYWWTIISTSSFWSSWFWNRKRMALWRASVAASFWCCWAVITRLVFLVQKNISSEIGQMNICGQSHWSVNALLKFVGFLLTGTSVSSLWERWVGALGYTD